MKVDSHLMLVKGQFAAGPGDPQTGRPATRGAAPEVVVLVSQENRRAQQLRPAGLEEARKLLHGVTEDLRNRPEEVLAETHRLHGHCLVRLF